VSLCGRVAFSCSERVPEYKEQLGLEGEQDEDVGDGWCIECALAKATTCNLCHVHTPTKFDP
jgi:hypothetical protein